MNPCAKFPSSHTQSKRGTAVVDSKFFFVVFPNEETHGVWPEKLIRVDRKNKFAFEAKFGTKWYSCHIEYQGKESLTLRCCLLSGWSRLLSTGSEEDCRQAQVQYEGQSNANRREWSSVETEESASSGSSSDENDSCIDEAENFDYRSPVKNRKTNKNSSKRKKETHQPAKESVYEPSIDLLAQISRDLNNICCEYSVFILLLSIIAEETIDAFLSMNHQCDRVVGHWSSIRIATHLPADYASGNAFSLTSCSFSSLCFDCTWRSLFQHVNRMMRFQEQRKRMKHTQPCHQESFDQAHRMPHPLRLDHSTTTCTNNWIFFKHRLRRRINGNEFYPLHKVATASMTPKTLAISTVNSSNWSGWWRRSILYRSVPRSKR